MRITRRVFHLVVHEQFSNHCQPLSRLRARDYPWGAVFAVHAEQHRDGGIAKMRDLVARLGVWRSYLSSVQIDMFPASPSKKDWDFLKPGSGARRNEAKAEETTSGR